METVTLSAGTPEETRDAVTQAVNLLNKGSIVALPTETVYGLAANAFNAEACTAIFEVKERPSLDPLIVHVSGKKMLDSIVNIPPDIEETVEVLIQEFWPGPLTMVLPKKNIIPDIVTAGLQTVAVRRSKNSVFSEIINELDLPLAAPSANIFGSMSPTSASAVHTELSNRIPLIIDGGACSDGVESTIIRIESTERPKPNIHLLRPGPVTVEMLKKFGKVVKGQDSQSKNERPNSPGQLASHYSPRTPLRIVNCPENFKADPSKSYALLSYRGQEKDGYLGIHDWKEIQILSPGSGKLPEAAVRFFFSLRKLDESGADEIIAEPIPEKGVGLAILDRLQRAAL